MSAKRMMVTLAATVAAVSGGGAIMAASAASGSAPSVDQPTATPTPSTSTTTTLTPTPTPTPTLTPTKTPTPPPSGGGSNPVLHLNTLHLVTRNVSIVNLGGGRQVITFQLRRNGRAVGTGVDTCHRTGGSTFGCKSAVALAGGIIMFSDTVNFRGGSVNGTILGGSGSYAGASGTVNGAARSDGSVNLTLHY